CRNIRGYQKEPEKFMAVEWDKETAQEFITEIKVDMFNHQGALDILRWDLGEFAASAQRVIEQTTAKADRIVALKVFQQLTDL
uniref:hypothetical protein n=1 Tax=Klebsiella pneumoniae TaxID=573 RepID=UPI001F457F79